MHHTYCTEKSASFFFLSNPPKDSNLFSLGVEITCKVKNKKQNPKCFGQQTESNTEKNVTLISMSNAMKLAQSKRLKVNLADTDTCLCFISLINHKMFKMFGLSQENCSQCISWKRLSDKFGKHVHERHQRRRNEKSDCWADAYKQVWK